MSIASDGSVRLTPTTTLDVVTNSEDSSCCWLVFGLLCVNSYGRFVLSGRSVFSGP